MGLFEDALNNSADRYKGRGCAVGKLLGRLDDDDRRELTAALSSDHVTGTGLFRALRGRYGQSAPSGYTIQRHRRGICGCEPT